MALWSAGRGQTGENPVAAGHVLGGAGAGEQLVDQLVRELRRIVRINVGGDERDRLLGGCPDAGGLLICRRAK